MQSAIQIGTTVKGNIILDTLLGPKPETMDLQLEPSYNETIIASSAQSEREKNAYIKNCIANATENSHYNPQPEKRLNFDESSSGLGAALKQLTVDGRKPIAFKSRFLNSCEERYSVNELELLGVVWSIEYLNNYLYNKHFTVITDYRTLLCILKENCSNKSYNSQLTRWIDRLLPIQFDIEHLPGAKMGLDDYVSRHHLLSV